MWFNIDTRGHKKAQKSQNIAVGPEEKNIFYSIEQWFVITEKYFQSPKNMGNLGTRFLRKVSKSEEGLTRISRINVAKTGGKGY